MTALLDRVVALERLLGDPMDPANPVGEHAFAAADERREQLAAATAVLDSFDFGAEFVPSPMGGRLDSMEDLAQVLRPVFRRDLGLGFGYGVTSFFAAAPVWMAGTDAQRKAVAARLLAGRPAAVVHHSLARGTRVFSGELTAVAVPGGFRLNGRKEFVLNTQADVFVAYVRTPAADGSHSVLLIEEERLPPGSIGRLPRASTPGLRSCHHAGLEFTGCTLPADGLVADLGDGLRLALRGAVLNWSVVLTAMLAGADTALRTAVDLALDGGRKWPAPRHRQALAGVFADLLACGSLAQVALRSLHVAAGGTDILTATAKYLVPTLLRDDLEELIIVGRRRSTRLVRDLSMIGLATGAITSQAMLLPQLPVLARRSWLVDDAPPASLFTVNGPLAPLDLTDIRIAGEHDPLAAALPGAADRIKAGADTPRLRALLSGFAGELGALKDLFSTLSPHDPAALATPEVRALADRYALVVTASACVAAWENGGGPEDPAWLLLALHRLGSRLGSRLDRAPSDALGPSRERVLAEVIHRFRKNLSYDLYRTQLSGSSR